MRPTRRLALLVMIATPLGAQSPFGVINLAQSLNPVDACVMGAPIPIVPKVCPTVNGVATLTSGAVTATFQAKSAVGGPLGAAATLDVVNARGASYTALARAGYYDQFTVHGSGATAARFSFTMDGIGSTTGTDAFPNARPTYGVAILLNYGANDVPSTFAAVGTAGAIATSRQFVVPGDGLSHTGTLDIPLVGAMNNILFWFAAVVGVSRPSTVAAGSAWSASGSADFMHTLSVDGVQAVDANGAVLGGPVSITSASGTLSSVPEPTTFGLVGLGLVGALFARRRRA